MGTLSTALDRSSRSLSVSQKLGYALPLTGVTFLAGPIGIISGIYAKHFGLALTTIASVFLISRLFDAITDPLIGHLSDRYKARTGSRKHFIVGGAVLFIVSSYFLFVPVDPTTVKATTSISTIYFLFWFLAFYLALTVFDIPHLAWGGELAVTPEDKNTIFAWRAVAGLIGNILFYAFPLLPIFDSHAFTPEILKWAVIIAGMIMIVVLVVSMRSVPDGRHLAAKQQNEHFHTQNQVKHNQHLRQLLHIIVNNRPFLLFLGAFILSGVGIGASLALLFIFIDSYLKLGEYYALVSLLGLIAGTLSLGLWHQLANRTGKKFTWAISTVVIVMGLLGIGILTPGEDNKLLLVLILVLIYSGFAAYAMLSPSLLSDIIDYSTWKFRVDYAASHFSIYTLVAKANVALGGALGLSIAGWYDFDPAATTYSSETLFGLRVAIAWLPAAMVLLSIIFILLIPIDARRLAIIRRHLDARTDQSRETQYSPPMQQQVQSTKKFMQTVAK